jgi:hypothetical protein
VKGFEFDFAYLVEWRKREGIGRRRQIPGKSKSGTSGGVFSLGRRKMCVFVFGKV